LDIRRLEGLSRAGKRAGDDGREAVGRDRVTVLAEMHDVLEHVLRPAVEGGAEIHEPHVRLALAELGEAFAHTLVARPQTQRTYRRACARFLRWLGPLPGPTELTAANVAGYHADLAAGGRSSATVKKDRAALNSFLRRA
jgi:hypothetical protein